MGGNEYRYLNRRRKFVEGFLFHDTEAAIEVNDIRKALHILSETCDAGEDSDRIRTNSAYVVRLARDTLAVSFSLRGIPHPEEIDHWHVTRESGRDYHYRAPQKGWFIDKIDDLSSPPVPWEYNEIYDKCLLLERATGACPCPKATDGSCRDQLLRPALPGVMQQPGVFDSQYRLEAETFKRVRYKTLPGEWVLVSSKATTRDDFARTFRPWSDYDFTIADKRKTTLKARGVARHIRGKFREDKCSACEFATKHPNDTYSDCGRIRSCTEAVDSTEAQGAVDAWLGASGFMSMTGFSNLERDYLVREAGAGYFSHALGGSRRMHVMLAGFRREYVDSKREWVYRVAAAKGDLSRRVSAPTYTALRRLVPDLPPSEAIKQVEPIAPHEYYGLACFGATPAKHYAFHGHLPIRKIALERHGVAWDVATKRYVLASGFFGTNATLYEAIRINPELDFHEVAQFYRNSLATKQLNHKRALPVTK
jgi:hypothetical protein